MKRLHLLTPLLLVALAASVVAAQQADTIATTNVAEGVTHTRFVRNAGPWIVNVVRVDLRRADLDFEHARAHDQLRTRERVTDMANRYADAGTPVIAGINADFFNLQTGEAENNQIVRGEWWKGVKVTDSPFDTFRNVHIQFALDSARHPMIDRFRFDGVVRSRNGTIPIIALNANPGAGPEATALYTPRFGPTTPRDTVRVTSEVVLSAAGHRGDTLLYLRRGAPSNTSGSAIPSDGVVLAGYGARAKEVAALAEGDTLRIMLAVSPRPASRAPIQLLIGGWPRVVRDGQNVAANAAADEGTISRNAEVRHPRSAVGFNRDSTQLLLVVVDGRSEKSVGMTTAELGALLIELGAWQGMNFDGGGSTTLVVKDKIVNTPSDGTGEREVGNALLVLSKRTATPARSSGTPLKSPHETPR
jgi:hypothetical protein